MDRVTTRSELLMTVAVLAGCGTRAVAGYLDGSVATRRTTRRCIEEALRELGRGDLVRIEQAEASA